MTEPIENRFWRSVTKTGTCWIWNKIGTNNGYGSFVYQGARYMAHRLAYEWLVGPIPAGLVIDHLCRNKRCVRPEHLEAVTRAENGRRNRSAWTCFVGHEMPANLVDVFSCPTCDAIIKEILAPRLTGPKLRRQTA